MLPSIIQVPGVVLDLDPLLPSSSDRCQYTIESPFCAQMQKMLNIATNVVCYCISGRYLSELLAERNKLNPFMAVLPNCYRLLNQGEFMIQNLSSLLYRN